jgi:hypothetical protein
MFFRPNLLILPEAVYDALEYHPRLLDKLGKANLIKKVDEANLAKLFRIDKVVTAKGRARADALRHLGEQRGALVYERNAGRAVRGVWPRLASGLTQTWSRG